MHIEPHFISDINTLSTELTQIAGKIPTESDEKKIIIDLIRLFEQITSNFDAIKNLQAIDWTAFTLTPKLLAVRGILKELDPVTWCPPIMGYWSLVATYLYEEILQKISHGHYNSNEPDDFLVALNNQGLGNTLDGILQQIARNQKTYLANLKKELDEKVQEPEAMQQEKTSYLILEELINESRKKMDDFNLAKTVSQSHKLHKIVDSLRDSEPTNIDENDVIAANAIIENYNQTCSELNDLEEKIKNVNISPVAIAYNQDAQGFQKVHIRKLRQSISNSISDFLTTYSVMPDLSVCYGFIRGFISLGQYKENLSEYHLRIARLLLETPSCAETPAILEVCQLYTKVANFLKSIKSSTEKDEKDPVMSEEEFLTGFTTGEEAAKHNILMVIQTKIQPRFLLLLDLRKNAVLQQIKTTNSLAALQTLKQELPSHFSLHGQIQVPQDWQTLLTEYQQECIDAYYQQLESLLKNITQQLTKRIQETKEISELDEPAKELKNLRATIDHIERPPREETITLVQSCIQLYKSKEKKLQILNACKLKAEETECTQTLSILKSIASEFEKKNTNLINQLNEIGNTFNIPPLDPAYFVVVANELEAKLAEFSKIKTAHLQNAQGQVNEQKNLSKQAEDFHLKSEASQIWLTHARQLEVALENAFTTKEFTQYNENNLQIKEIIGQSLAQGIEEIVIAYLEERNNSVWPWLYDKVSSANNKAYLDCIQLINTEKQKRKSHITNNTKKTLDDEVKKLNTLEKNYQQLNQCYNAIEMQFDANLRREDFQTQAQQVNDILDPIPHDSIFKVMEWLQAQISHYEKKLKEIEQNKEARIQLPLQHLLNSMKNEPIPTNIELFSQTWQDNYATFLSGIIPARDTILPKTGLFPEFNKLYNDISYQHTIYSHFLSSIKKQSPIINNLQQIKDKITALKSKLDEKNYATTQTTDLVSLIHEDHFYETTSQDFPHIPSLSVAEKKDMRLETPCFITKNNPSHVIVSQCEAYCIETEKALSEKIIWESKQLEKTLESKKNEWIAAIQKIIIESFLSLDDSETNVQQIESMINNIAKMKYQILTPNLIMEIFENLNSLYQPCDLVRQKTMAKHAIRLIIPHCNNLETLTKLGYLVTQKHEGKNPYEFIRLERDWFRMRCGNTATWEYIIKKIRQQIAKQPLTTKIDPIEEVAIEQIWKTQTKHTYGLGFFWRRDQTPPPSFNKLKPLMK